MHSSPGSHRKKGDAGEALAKDFLQLKGYTFLEQNFCIPGGEIDLIFQDGDEIVFVEVKTRNTKSFGDIEESITPAKVKHLEFSAKKYFLKNRLHWYEDPFRFDAVFVDSSDASDPKVEHVKHVFGFDDFL